MPEQPEPYAIYALKYATRIAPASECFLGAEAHEPPLRMDYFVWVVTNARHTLVLDTGFSEEVARRRGRDYERNPAEGLRALGIDPAKVDRVVLSHMHYDHVGNIARFPNARFQVQEIEMAFYTGPAAHYPRFSKSMEVEDVVGLVRANYDGRLELSSGDLELLPGITMHLVGGHTAGSQIMRVATARGTVVLAADAAHYYEEVEQLRPFPTLHDLAKMYRAYETVNRLADSPGHVIPGHDPLVMERYPAVAKDTPWIVKLA
ncbi:MAG: N-acyl homoserine lactonase family protein [Dehalococcoidia bacterium]|nr:N-acyl homoserine lactonase family protein [Dehalococcoidia bacterium]